MCCTPFRQNPRREIKTAQHDIDLVEQRLKAARQDYEARYGK